MLINIHLLILSPMASWRLTETRSRSGCSACSSVSTTHYLILFLFAKPLKLLAYWRLRRRGTLYPVYTIKQSSSKHLASIEQTSSKYQAIKASVIHVYFECICWMFAWWLLDVCLIVQTGYLTATAAANNGGFELPKTTTHCRVSAVK